MTFAPMTTTSTSHAMLSGRAKTSRLFSLLSNPANCQARQSCQPTFGSQIGNLLLEAAPENMATLHLICGLPGSGKTTLSRKLEQTLPALRLSADDLTIPLVG